MDARGHTAARETQERPQFKKHGGWPRQGTMFAAGTVMFFAAVATAPGQPAQSAEQHNREQPAQARPEPPQPGPEQQIRDRFEQQRRELVQRQEELGRAARETEEQLQQSRRSSQEQSRELEGQLDEIRGQMRQTDQELAELHRREVAERTRLLMDQLRDHQEQSQRIERELNELRQTDERQMRGPEEQGRPSLEPRLRIREERREEMIQRPGRRANESPASRPPDGARGQSPELRQGQDALRAEMQRLKQQVQSAREALEQRQAQDRAAGAERSELLRQMEMLRDRTNRLEQELGASNERNRALAEGSKNAMRDARAIIEQMQQGMARLERERLERQEVCEAEMKGLCSRVDKLQGELTQTHALLNSMLSQTGRSAVGSAGYAWGW